MTIQIPELCSVYVFPRSPDRDLECRIRGEYREKPTLRLSKEQAMRLWALDRATCARVLDRLIDTGFLHRDLDGRYAGHVPF